MNKALRLCQQRGLSQLIIDLSNNPGGRICLGRMMLSYLVNSTQQNWGPTDLPLSPLARACIKKAARDDITWTIWSPSLYDDQQGRRIASNDTGLLLPGVCVRLASVDWHQCH
jgi:hypothetical protein